MKYQVPMPSLGADMDQGKLMDWKIKVGDEVKKGQTIAVVETT
jgi:pyruvate dehydrogenase E2 component (dihydrolipoamide acetyltransferase)